MSREFYNRFKAASGEDLITDRDVPSSLTRYLAALKLILEPTYLKSISPGKLPLDSGEDNAYDRISKTAYLYLPPMEQ